MLADAALADLIKIAAEEVADLADARSGLGNLPLAYMKGYAHGMKDGQAISRLVEEHKEA